MIFKPGFVLILFAAASFGRVSCAETVTFDVLPAPAPAASSVSVELEGPLLIGSDSDDSALSGTALIDLGQTTAPFGTATIAELTLVLDDGMDLSLAFGQVSARAEPGLTRVTMLDPGFSTPVENGLFTQEAAIFQFEGQIDLSTQEEPFDLETVAPITVDLDGIRILEEANQLVAELTVDLEFSAAIATENFGQIPLAIRIVGNARAVAGKSLPGDVNTDGVLDVHDIDTLATAIRTGLQDGVYDLNGDGSTDAQDHAYLISERFDSYFGDANLDGEFNSSDLVGVFQAGEYEDALPGNSSWATGDWNGDAEFDSGDIVFAFQAGAYEQGPRMTALAVPEPSGGLCLLLVTLLAVPRRR